MAARKQKQRRMSAQVVEDEDYQLRYEIVAGIDAAKESAVVCVRMPRRRGRSAGRRTCRRCRTIGQRIPALDQQWPRYPWLPAGLRFRASRPEGPSGCLRHDRVD